MCSKMRGIVKECQVELKYLWRRIFVVYCIGIEVWCTDAPKIYYLHFMNPFLLFLQVASVCIFSEVWCYHTYLLMSASGPARVFTEFSIICSLLGVHLVILLPEKHHTLTFWEDQYLVIHGAFCVNFATQKRPEQFLWVCSI